MFHSLTIELPEEVFEYVRRMAAKAGQTPEQWARERLEAIVPGTVFMTPEERERALAELKKNIGTSDLGYPTGADNERIDHDLADEYASTHEEEH